MPRVESRILRLCRTVQATVPGYGAARLEPADLFGLLVEAGLNVAEVEGLPIPALAVPPGTPSRVLVRAGLPEAVQHYVVLREIGCLLSSPDAPPVVPTVFALCGVLNSGVAEGDAASGPRTRREVISDLRSVPELWESVSFRYVLRLARRVLRKVVGPEVENADPAEGWRAYEEGRAARRASDYARAETLFRTAIRIARSGREWKLLGLSLLGLAKTSEQRGNYPEADHRFRRALRAAERYGILSVEGMIWHDYFLLAVDIGERKEAMRRAERAFEIYRGTQHADLPRLAHDVGYYWITIGDFRSALIVVQESVPFMRCDGEAMLVWANVARAAAGAGRRELFCQAVAAAELHAAALAVKEHLPRSLVHISMGASHMGKWDLAEHYALRALEVARSRSETVSRLMAEALLRALPKRSTLEAPSVPPTARRCSLAQGIVSALRERKPDKVPGSGTRE